MDVKQSFHYETKLETASSFEKVSFLSETPSSPATEMLVTRFEYSQIMRDYNNEFLRGSLRNLYLVQNVLVGRDALSILFGVQRAR